MAHTPGYEVTRDGKVFSSANLSTCQAGDISRSFFGAVIR